MSIPRDVQQFLDRYPDVERTDSDSNLRFYSNSTPCEPDGVLIEDILREYALFVDIRDRFTHPGSWRLVGVAITINWSPSMVISNGCM